MSMIYDVRLVIRHEYATAVGTGRHLLHVTPADIPGRQICRSRVLAVDPPPEEQGGHLDFFGNRAEMILHERPHDEMELELTGQVEVMSQESQLDMAPPLAQLPREISEVRVVDAASPHHFTGPSLLIPHDRKIGDFARGCISADMSVREAVLAIGEAIHAGFTFDAEATTVDTTPQEAFARKSGVCQDYSHVMITCLREVGIPAGYVSGYLRTIPPKGEPRLEGADAMHAWVRAWCGTEMGWIEYDPTNSTIAGIDHLVVANGRDYSDVAPVKGVLLASGGQVASHSVDVVPRTDLA